MREREKARGDDRSGAWVGNLPCVFEWERKANVFEQEILFLIDQNLVDDSQSIVIELNKTKQAVQLTNRLLKKVAQKEYSDSLNFWMAKIISFERFKSQSSAFEVLKAKGIENLSDKKLQAP